jgi:1,4-alpha-glucan branching enzyme
MSKKSLVLHMTLHQGYFRHLEGKHKAKNEILFSSISQVYLPLLNMFANLESDGIPFKIGLTISPTLCSLLSDPVIQQSYIEWLDSLITLGEAEVKRYSQGSEQYNLAKIYLKNCKRDKRDFVETFNQDILSKFDYYAKRGSVELFATCATNCFLPHYIDMNESICAQVETGLQSHKTYFDVVPEGFWLPDMGYTQGIENILRSYGINYSILDTHGVLFSTPLPKNGIFTPVRTANSFAFFARDSETPADITGSLGYMWNPAYRNQDRDIGFDSDMELLSGFLGESRSRVSTGFKYWARSENQKNAALYNFNTAKECVQKDAKSFLDKKSEKLTKASQMIDAEEVSLVCAMDASIFGQTWYEGIDWLESLFRQAAEREDIVIEHCTDLAKSQFTLQKVQPFHSAASGTGYGEDLLDSSNDWMMKYIRKSTERMIDLAERFSDDTGLKARALNLAAKEILLAQSSDWAAMTHQRMYPEYASERFSQSVNAFATVFESLGSNSISTEWLTNMEREHTLFPWINYRVFSRKK